MSRAQLVFRCVLYTCLILLPPPFFFLLSRFTWPFLLLDASSVFLGRSAGTNHILVVMQEWFCFLPKGGSLILATTVGQRGKSDIIWNATWLMPHATLGWDATQQNLSSTLCTSCHLSQGFPLLLRLKMSYSLFNNLS